MSLGVRTHAVTVVAARVGGGTPLRRRRWQGEEMAATSRGGRKARPRGFADRSTSRRDVPRRRAAEDAPRSQPVVVRRRALVRRVGGAQHARERVLHRRGRTELDVPGDGRRRTTTTRYRARCRPTAAAMWARPISRVSVSPRQRAVLAPRRPRSDDEDAALADDTDDETTTMRGTETHGRNVDMSS